MRNIERRRKRAYTRRPAFDRRSILEGRVYQHRDHPSPAGSGKIEMHRIANVHRLARVGIKAPERKLEDLAARLGVAGFR